MELLFRIIIMVLSKHSDSTQDMLIFNAAINDDYDDHDYDDDPKLFLTYSCLLYPKWPHL